MRGAREDLSANVPGRFSPDDWTRILTTARERFETRRAHSNLSELEDWQAVVLDFYRSRYWGYANDYRPPSPPKKKGNLGIRLVWLLFVAFTLTEAGIAWTGQNYAKSGDRGDFLILLLVIAAVVGNILFFLWQYRHHQD